MKRGEVLSKLRRYYGERNVNVAVQSYITPNQFMEEILTLVEEMGMLPPRRFNVEEYDFNKGYIYVNGEINHNAVPKYVNTWEPEDENKV